MRVAEDEEPAEGVSIILELKPDVGNPHVRFDERGHGNVVRVEIKTPTKGENRRKQRTPQPNTIRAGPRLYPYYFIKRKICNSQLDSLIASLLPESEKKNADQQSEPASHLL